MQSLICREACPATASGTCWGNFSTLIKGGQYIFSLNEQSCLLNRKRREGDGEGREGDGERNSAFRGHWSYLAGISKPQSDFPAFLWFKPKALTAYLLQIQSLNRAAPTAARSCDILLSWGHQHPAVSCEMMGGTCCAQISRESHAVPPAYPALGTAALRMCISPRTSARHSLVLPQPQLLWEVNPSQSGFS